MEISEREFAVKIQQASGGTMTPDEAMYAAGLKPVDDES